MQVELQRRRCTTVQGTQNGQTPLDAQADAERQMLAVRQGRCRRAKTENNDDDNNFIFRFPFPGVATQAFQSVLSFSSKEIIALTCSWCKLSVHNKTACFNDTKMNEPCTLGERRTVVSLTAISVDVLAGLPPQDNHFLRNRRIRPTPERRQSVRPEHVHSIPGRRDFQLRVSYNRSISVFRTLPARATTTATRPHRRLRRSGMPFRSGRVIFFENNPGGSTSPPLPPQRICSRRTGTGLFSVVAYANWLGTFPPGRGGCTNDGPSTTLLSPVESREFPYFPAPIY